MINNFDQIFSILPDEKEEDLTYYCQVVKRKKDHPGLEGSNNSSRLVKPYYFGSRHDLAKRWKEMTAIAEVTGARIMIDLFPKHSGKVKYEMLKRLAEIIESDNIAKLHRLFNTCYGSMTAPKNRKLWLIDWDFKDTSALDECIEETKGHQTGEVKIIHKIPTKQGWHYLIKPCEIKILSDIIIKKGMETPDVHKNSPTILYIPDSIK